MGRDIIAIVGPTASGKTRRAVDIARAVGGEIVSADSRQLYRGMDLGTGKDLDEYGEVPYHMIDVAPAGYRCNLYQYLRDARRAVDDIRSRGRVAVICGGTGMYVETLLKGTVLPEVPENPGLRTQLQGKSLEELAAMLATMKTLHNVTDVDTCQRAIRAIEIQIYYQQHPEEAEAAMNPQPLDAAIVGVDIPRDIRRRRISERLSARLQSGMIEEVRRLLGGESVGRADLPSWCEASDTSQAIAGNAPNAGPLTPDDLIYYGLEYKFVTLHVTGQLSYDEMYRELETAIHQFAKRQMTWFRGMERRGLPIHWLPYDLSTDDFVAQATALLNQ